MERIHPRSSNEDVQHTRGEETKQESRSKKFWVNNDLSQIKYSELLWPKLFIENNIWCCYKMHFYKAFRISPFPRWSLFPLHCSVGWT